MSALREKLIRNFNEIELETSTRAPLYDGSRSGGVAGQRVGTVARKLGAGVDIVPPGKRACPYHFHYAQEEMFVVLEGEGTLRVAGEMIPIRAGDVIGIPPGPEYPHQIINTSNAPLKFLSISTQEVPEVCEYPDSGKYLAYARTKGPLLDGGRMHRSDTDLDYWDGEP
ncbi:MAG TPA: cupin domain-containing protein [Burkholderiaceae bacterium]|nr:cupin domain-containing protein [Burkholderiaceae bacterium]HQR76715.1 cupin domain-containing protein [Burkholderiaceae bacterium]